MVEVESNSNIIHTLSCVWDTNRYVSINNFISVFDDEDSMQLKCKHLMLTNTLFRNKVLAALPEISHLRFHDKLLCHGTNHLINQHFEIRSQTNENETSR